MYRLVQKKEEIDLHVERKIPYTTNKTTASTVNSAIPI